MKKVLIVVLTVAGAVAGYLYNPAPAECQVGAPCGGTKSSIAAVALEVPGLLRTESDFTAVDLADAVENEATATDGYVFTDPDGNVQIVAAGAKPTGTWTASCADFIADGCGVPVGRPVVRVSDVKGDCGLNGTSGVPSRLFTIAGIQAPTVGCSAGATLVVPAPPNDIAVLTLDDVRSGDIIGGDSWAVVNADFFYATPNERAGEAGDGCSVVYGDPMDALTTEIDSYDTDFISTYLEGVVAVGATGVCCVAETAYGTPAQIGCLYQGGSFGPLTYQLSSFRCAWAAEVGATTGGGVEDLCETFVFVEDTNNVCPQDWCTLNPLDPACGGDPD